MAYPKISVATAYQYGPRKWLDTLVATKSSVDLFKQYLTFDDAGQITKQVSEHGTSGTVRQDYLYDALGQLTTWLKDSGTGNELSHIYAYDSVGNRTKTTTGVQLGVTGWTNNDIGRHLGAPEPNQLKEAKQYNGLGTLQGSNLYFYDANGAQTRRMLLDASQVPLMDESFTYSTWRGLPSTFTRTDPNMPMGMPNKWEWQYRYNAMGEREQKRETLTPASDSTAANGYDWTYYLLAGNRKQMSIWKGLQTSDQTFCSMPGGGGSYVHLYPSAYLTHGGSPALITQKLNNAKEYRVADYLGSNRVVVDNTGTVLSTADYEPFGKPLSGSTEDRLSWIDKERDGENGYGNFGVRSFDYDIGRFTSIDLLWEEYRSWSPYQYSLNNPLLLADPSGLVVEWDGWLQAQIDAFMVMVNKDPLLADMFNVMEESDRVFTMGYRKSKREKELLEEQGVDEESLNPDATYTYAIEPEDGSNGIGSDVYIAWKSTNIVRGGRESPERLAASKEIRDFLSSVVAHMGHEIFHGLRMANGRDDMGFIGSFPVREANGLAVENYFLLRLGLSQRTVYFGQEIPEGLPNALELLRNEGVVNRYTILKR